MPIRNLLQTLRKARGVSASELAKLVDVSRQTIYAIEDGSFIPNTAIALRLARALDVSVGRYSRFTNRRGPGTSTPKF
jgi:DNA-binding XRE family transcriptional regulator